MDSQVTRHDLFHIGLNSKNVLKILDSNPPEDDVLATGIIGDQTGCLQSFRIKSNYSTDAVRLTMPSPDSSVSAVEIINVPEKQPKVMAATTPLGLKCFSTKGKVVFSLELSHLTEPIRHVKFSWPHDLFICTDYVFYAFSLNPEASSKYSLTLLDTYTCSDKITGIELLRKTSKFVSPFVKDHTRGSRDSIGSQDRGQDRSQDRSHSNGSVYVCLTAKDRLIRILDGSNALYEIETTGIPTCVGSVPNLGTKNTDCLFSYGSAPLGKVSMIAIDFNQDRKMGRLKPQIKWEVPEGRNIHKSPVECISVSESGIDLFVGRSDGTIDGYTFATILDLEGHQLVSVSEHFPKYQKFRKYQKF